MLEIPKEGDLEVNRTTLLIFCALGSTLSGCGAVNSLIPEIDDLARLNGTTVEATVGSGRALISGNVSRAVSFADRDLPQVSQLRRLKLRQSIDGALEVSVPGNSYPASFSLSNIGLQVRLTDGARVADASASVAGPITFTREGTTNIYRTSGPVEISNLTYSNATFSTARDIITTAPSPNSASGRLSFDTDDTQLPSGSVLKFTFVNGKARVEL